VASIKERVSKSGERRYAVLYRLNGRQTSTTFDAAPKPHRPDKYAADFKALVDILGPEKAIATLTSNQAGGLTVDQLFERWIEWKASTEVTERTLKEYRRDYANWIRPHLGGRAAASIDELDVQGWVDAIAARLDPKTVGDRHMILGSMFRFGSAKSRRLVDHNPCLETQLPSKKRKAVKGFSIPQWEAMHAWGAEQEPDADDLLLFIASTGWRFSECTPVTPAAVEDQGDVGLDDGSVLPLVWVSVRGVHRRDADDRIYYAEGEGKSQAAIRRVNLPAEAARMIRRRLVGRGIDDLVFTNRHGSQWRSNNFLEREFPRILEGAGITKVKGMGPHYLRHTHVGMLDRAGVSAAKTQRRIGHENLSTTFGVYGGMIDNSLSPAELVRLNAQLGGEPAAAVVVRGDVVRGQLA
jgi:site-specific recombinase XerD